MAIYDNFFLTGTNESIDYRSRSRGRGPTQFPPRQRQTQGQKIIQRLNEIRESGTMEGIVPLAIENGTYIEFQSSKDFSLTLKSLENKRQGIELMNVRRKETEDGVIEYATVYIPRGAEHHFINKAQEYLENETISGKPRNLALIDSIEDINLALVESFFPENHVRLINEEIKDWYEVWISTNQENAEEKFKALLVMLELEMKPEKLEFPERVIFMIYANKLDLANLIHYSPSISEIRKATVANAFFLDMDTNEQMDWVNDLNERIIKEETNTVINIIDTGVRRTHPLLEDFIETDDTIAYNPAWNPFDRVNGHGTAMAGIALYDELSEKMESSDVYEVTHSLESSKILPDTGTNEPALYGAITTNVISKQEIANPTRRRVNCMAVTSPEIDTYDGRPSSWSAAIDEVTSGAIDEKKKLILISAGNVREYSQWMSYPNINQISSVENPGQSWNALTIGAYTQRDDISKVSIPGMQPIAPNAGLSPTSKTSIVWDNKWPIKPEVLFEGGNGIKSEFEADAEENYTALTTYHHTDIRLFHIISDTSEATAHGSWMAAKIWSKYPDIWPETVRALIVHSARWTERMKQQFLIGTRKRDYRNLLRTCGYGVPDLNRALSSMDNNVNMVIESELQPYKFENATYKTNEMHIHELPWPKEELLVLGATRVQLKVTLSYFIEPGPGEKGWKNQYRYPSSLLRFELNGAKTKEEFLRSINSLVDIDDDDDDENVSTGADWTLGKQRDVGSIHSDYWEGTAAELATSNLIGIYPAIGWWKERKSLGKGENKLRYSLVVSLSSEEEVNLYTPISNQISGKLEV